MKKILSFSLLIVLSMSFVSCQRENDKPEPKPDNGKFSSCYISQMLVKVELEDKGDDGKNRAKQIENEIKKKLPFPENSTLRFLFSDEDAKEGKLIAIHNNKEIIKTNFTFEKTTNTPYLKIQYDGGNTDIFELQYGNGAMVKDFAKEFESSDYSIITALGGYRFTIQR